MRRIEALEKLKRARTVREAGLDRDGLIEALEDVSYSSAMNSDSQTIAELKQQIDERDETIKNLRDSLKKQRSELKKLRNEVD